MHFDSPLIEARLVRRYKRFLVDVEINGEIITAHCANPGAMTGLIAPGNRVWLSRSANTKRKLPLSWEMVEASFGVHTHIVGINTSHPNRIAAEAIKDGLIPELSGYTQLRREVRYGKKSRIDILLEAPDRQVCYVEVKNVHLMREHGLAEFPDSVTTRGARHLEELGEMVEAGHRAVMLFIIQMPAKHFTVAADIDPGYGQAFTRAKERGVEVLAIACHVDPGSCDMPASITIGYPVSVI